MRLGLASGPGILTLWVGNSDCRIRSAILKRPFLTLIAATMLIGSARAADISVNELTKMLFAANGGQSLNLAGKDFSGLDLSGLNFKKANLTKADLFGADLTDASLSGVDLSGAKLDRATIVRTDFSGANLDGATMLVPAAFLRADKAGQEAPRFGMAKLSRFRAIGNFRQIDFHGADLKDADFSPLTKHFSNDAYPASRRTAFRSCDFTDSKLTGAIFRHAILEFSSFVNADLSGADLKDADLTKANLTGANLDGADVTGANFDSADLRQVRGLDRVIGLASVRNLDRAFR